MKYLITGANGYIGCHITEILLEQGHEVFAADVNYNNVNERAICLDINIFSGQEDIYKKCQEPDICIHLAWKNGFIHNADTHIEDLPNHFVFLKNMMKGGLKHLLVMGSMHEVGYWEGAITEDTPTNPKSLYGIAKNALRQITIELAQENEVCLQWIRGYYILGDDLKNKSIFAKILIADKERKEKFPFTTGKNKYDFIQVEELASQIVAVSEQESVRGIINCCSGTPISLAERVEKFIGENNLSIKLEYGVFPDREYDSPAIWGDATKIQSIISKK